MWRSRGEFFPGLCIVYSSPCTGKMCECVLVGVLLCWLIKKLDSTCTKLSLSRLNVFLSCEFIVCGVVFFFFFNNGHGILPTVCLGK